MIPPFLVARLCPSRLTENGERGKYAIPICMELNLNYINFTASGDSNGCIVVLLLKIQEITEIQELYTTYKQLYMQNLEAREDEGVEVKSKSNNSAFVILC